MNYVSLDDIYAFIIHNLDEFEPSSTDVGLIRTGGYIIIVKTVGEHIREMYDIYPLTEDRWIIRKKVIGAKKRIVTKESIVDEITDIIYEGTIPNNINIMFNHQDKFNFDYDIMDNNLYRESIYML